MNFADILHETYTALSANKVRSGLTMLGIIIGISSVIAMVAIGNGAQGSIKSSIQSAGANLITVTPGAQQGPGFQISTGRGAARTLKPADAEAIASDIPLVKAVSAELTSRYQVAARGTNTNTSVVGATQFYPDVRNVQVEEGSWITEQNLRSLSKVAILGPAARDDLFGEGEPATGQTIRINSIQFRVIGVTVPKGGTGFNNQDDMIFIPLTTAQKFLAGDTYVSSISVQAVDADSMAPVQQQITNLLLERHKISDPAEADFSTFNQADLTAAVSTVTQTFTILLGSVAGISLLVGGIGIMNMMLTTVTERTREIGLRKAVGAKKKDINRQFLAEAVALTFMGGVIGVVLGWLISYGVTWSGLLQTQVTLGSVLLAFGVSAAIGIAFGYYPARRAAALNPIDALRYE